MAGAAFVETNAESAAGAVALVVAAVFSPPYVREVLVFTAIGALLANQCHKWAHQPSVPHAVRVLQRYGIVLSPNVHRLHHRRPHDTHYCTASGWMNAPFNALLRAFR